MPNLKSHPWPFAADDHVVHTVHNDTKTLRWTAGAIEALIRCHLEIAAMDEPQRTESAKNLVLMVTQMTVPGFGPVCRISKDDEHSFFVQEMDADGDTIYVFGVIHRVSPDGSWYWSFHS